MSESTLQIADAGPLRPDNLETVEVPPPELIAEPTDGDLDAIEDKLLEDLLDDEAEDSIPTETKRVKKGRPPRKEKLISDIEKFRDSCPDLVPANWRLKKTRVKDLEILLARCVSSASGHPLRPNTEATAETDNQAATADGRPQLDPRLNQPGLHGKTVAGTMVDLNIVAMEMVEFGTQCAAPYTDGLVVSGAAAELREREAELEDIIRNVYIDNKEICDKFVSPTLAWASLMAAVSLKNVKKIDPSNGEILTPQEYIQRQKAAASANS